MTATLKTTNIQHESAATANITLTSDGNVGIGTASPTQKLIVTGTTGQIATVNSTAGETQFCVDGGSVAGRMYATGGGSQLIVGTFSNHLMSFYTNSTEKMRIDTSGNVGIGTTSPAFQQIAKGIEIETNDNVGYRAETTGANASVLELYSGSFAGTAGGTLSTIGSYPLMFGTNNTERMRIVSSGNVGISTTTPSHMLSLGKGTTSVNEQAVLFLQSGNGSGGARDFSIEGDGSGSLLFKDRGYNNANNGTGELMRIKYTGVIGIGTAGPNASTKVHIVGSSTDADSALDLQKGSGTTTTSQVYVRFFAPTATGSITANGVSAATFTAYSDRRLKENIEMLPCQLENICKLKPSEFDFIGYPEGEGHQIGFIAQDMQEVYPDVVSEGENGMLQISGWSKTEARLVKAIQEQQKIIETLEARVASLEAS